MAVPGWAAGLAGWTARTDSTLGTLTERQAAVASAQEHLEQAVAALNVSLTDLANEIAQLKVANPDVDFTSLDAAVARAQGLDAANDVPDAPQP